MLGHEYEDMPGRNTDINPHENTMLLRCRWCYKTPSMAREDGCARRELDANGKIRISLFNPEGMGRFSGRICVTCDGDIMDHWLRNDGTTNYFCSENGSQTSDGIKDPVWDIPEGFGLSTTDCSDSKWDE